MAKYFTFLALCVSGVALLIIARRRYACSHTSVMDAEDLSYLGVDGEYLSNSEADGELIFVHVVYRHGDRNPVNVTPGSGYTDLSYWPEGWGQMTNLGMQQGYELGRWLRRRHNKFLSNEYNRSEMAAMYLPRGNQIWKTNLLWKPIPVHTVPASTDYLVAAVIPNCTSYQNATDRYLASDEMKE